MRIDPVTAVPPPVPRRARRRRLLSAGAASLLVTGLVAVPEAAQAAPVNLARTAVATATSAEGPSLNADKAIDGDPATRWSSLFTDPQSITVDLGAKATVSVVTLAWESSYATAYSVATSVDGETWTELSATTSGDGGTDEIDAKGVTAKLIRVTGTQRVSKYGYSLYEIAVNGEFTEQAVGVAVPVLTLRERGTGQLKVRLNKAATSEVSVGYRSVDGTAKAGQDYQAATGRLTFAPGEVEKTVPIKGIDDPADEPTETFDVELTDATAGVIVGPRTRTTVSLTDDDVPTGDGRPKTILDYEGEVPFGEEGKTGIFAFGADADDKPVLTTPQVARAGAPAGNHVLEVKYGAEGYGGLSHNLAATQDWSAYGGFRFWFHGGNTAPLPPGSGPKINFEIKDGGENGEKSELWNTSFTDDFDGWTLIEIPFENFQYRGDYQPVGGINQIFDLNQVWGYAFTPPSGREGRFALDDLQVYGTALPPPSATVDTSAPVYPVDEGGTVTVGVRVSTPDGAPLDVDVTVQYKTGGGTATAGSDYTAASGSVTFAVGTESGAVRTFPVRTKKDRSAEVAETVEVSLTSSPDVRLSKDLPGTVVINAHGLPYLDKKLPIDKRVKDLLGRMSLAEKVGQMTQAERQALDAQDDIASYRLGSLLSGGGSTPKPNTPAAWADMYDGYQLRAKQTPLQIPLIYGVDAVHGHNNVVGATLFPHNIGLGATRDPELVQRVGAATATEVRATGPTWDFSPCLCVARDDRWGRTYEAFGEDPALVAAMSTIVDGLEGKKLSDPTSVLSTIKHWVGDGGTTFKSSTTGSYTTDQGVTQLSEADLRRLHIAPYVAALKRGVGSAMPSYSSWDNGSGPVKMHGNKYLITDVLKKELGFTGFVVSDWQAIDQIPGDYRSDIVTSVNAGLDMIMVPTEYQTFLTQITDAATKGDIAASRIDDAVQRILRKKFELGLFEKPYTDRTHLQDVGSPAHRAIGREAAAKSQTLLKNTGNLLPLKKDAKVYVAGSNADDLGNQSGGWSISWQGSSGPITTGTTILQGIKEVAPKATVTYSREATEDTAGHDVGVVVVGETPYAEGVGDVGNGRADLKLSAADAKTVDTVCAALKCVVLVVSGRPMELDATQLGGVEALVASWLPGTEGAGVADTLFGSKPYTGRLPMTWAKTTAQQPINVGDKVYDPAYAYGWGLRTDAAKPRLKAARDALHATLRQPGTFADKLRITLAVTTLDVTLAIPVWKADGSVRDDRAVLNGVSAASALLEGTAAPEAPVDRVVSVARDVVQAKLVTKPSAAASALTANAESSLLQRRPHAAVRQLVSAYDLAK
jgi:beta-glucosidase